MDSINVKDIPGKYLSVKNEAARLQLEEYATAGTLVFQKDDDKMFKAINKIYYAWWYEAHPGDPSWVYTESFNPKVGDKVWWYYPGSESIDEVKSVRDNTIEVGNYLWTKGSEENDVVKLGWEEFSEGIVVSETAPTDINKTYLYIGPETENFKPNTMYRIQNKYLYAYAEDEYPDEPIFTRDEVVTENSEFYYFENSELVSLEFEEITIEEDSVYITFSSGNDPICFNRNPELDVEDKENTDWREVISSSLEEALDSSAAALALAEEASEATTDAATAINIATNALENSKVLEDQLPNAVGNYYLRCAITEDPNTGDLVKTLTWEVE